MLVSWPGSTYLASVYLSFHICKMGRLLLKCCEGTQRLVYSDGHKQVRHMLLIKWKPAASFNLKTWNLRLHFLGELWAANEQPWLWGAAGAAAYRRLCFLSPCVGFAELFYFLLPASCHFSLLQGHFQSHLLIYCSLRMRKLIKWMCKLGVHGLRGKV